MRIFTTGFLALIPLFFAMAGVAQAEQAKTGVAATTKTGKETAADFAEIRSRVEKELGEKVDSITASAIPGIYEVLVPPKLFYMSADGRYLFTGDLIDLHEKVNLSSDKRSTARMSAVDKLGESEMIVFSPKEVKHTITVFTDIDCGYCRKLHSEMASYNKLGIKVRYMAYPRAGIGSESYDKAVSVWCADDKAKAMTAAKSGGKVAKKTCDNPVAKEFALGQELGVNGTPALLLENGQIYPGYAPADKLIAVLDQIKSQTAAVQ